MLLIRLEPGSDPNQFTISIGHEEKQAKALQTYTSTAILQSPRLMPDVGWFQHQRPELKTKLPTVACNGGDAYTAEQPMEGYNYADTMEVQRGVDAITT